MQAICTAASLRNTKLKNKPNEDYFICDGDSGIFVLLDGVSRDGNENNYPNPSPSAIISEIVANTVYQYLKRSDLITREVERVLIEAVSYGNDAAKEYNENNRIIPLFKGNSGQYIDIVGFFLLMCVCIFRGVHTCHLCPGSLPLGGFRTALHTPSTSKCSHSECISHVVWVVSLLRLSSFKNEITLPVKDC